MPTPTARAKTAMARMARLRNERRLGGATQLGAGNPDDLYEEETRAPLGLEAGTLGLEAETLGLEAGALVLVKSSYKLHESSSAGIGGGLCRRSLMLGKRRMYRMNVVLFLFPLLVFFSVPGRSSFLVGWIAAIGSGFGTRTRCRG
jgi:hypothetical protein